MESEGIQWECAVKCARFIEISVFAERLIRSVGDVRISRNYVQPVNSVLLRIVAQSVKNLR